METKQPQKRGRKPQWTAEKVDMMCKAIAAGRSHKEAYTAARVSHTCFYSHMNNDAEFVARVKRAEQEYQEFYDSQLVATCKRSLMELISGYEWDETTTESALDKNGKMVETKRKVVHKKAAPNATAIIFALCNRAPEEWSNKHIQEISGKIETESKSDVLLANVPDELLGQVIDAINRK